MVTKRWIPKVYKVYRDRILKHCNWENKIHYSDALSMLGYYGIPKEVRHDILKEMIELELLKRENKHYIIIVGAKKSCFFG